jgi:hypothetical protein
MAQPSQTTTDEDLTATLRHRIAQTGEVPPRRSAAAELNVSEYRVRKALEVIQSEPVPVPAEPVAHDHPVGETVAQTRTVARWPLALLALPALVAIWSGWVGLGQLAGFGTIQLLPGIWDDLRVNSAITLPIGLETYAAYAMLVWLSGVGGPIARQFARKSALGSLGLGAAGQIAYHVMDAAGLTSAPWWITALVATLPVAVFGMGAALYHLIAHRIDA